MSFDKNDKSALSYFDICKSEYSQPMSELQSFTEGRQFEYCEAMAREQKLLEVISVLKEGCGFYANKDNWGNSDPLADEWIYDCILMDIDKDHGGRHAREALAKVDEMLKEIGVGK